MNAYKILIIIPLCMVSIIGVAGDLQEYVCVVETIHDKDSIGSLWANAKLLYNAKTGVLEAEFDPTGELTKRKIAIPRKKVFLRLKVQTWPSNINNLHAVQFDPVGFKGNIRPIVAWITIKTIDSKIYPKFIFFSNSIETTLEGKCISLRF